jgi:hypothetical protein
MFLNFIIDIMIFVGTPDYYMLCALFTLFVTLVVFGIKYRSYNERDKERIQENLPDHIWGSIIIACFWPATWIFTFCFCFIKSYFYFLNQENIFKQTYIFLKNKIKDIKIWYEQKQDISLTKKAMLGQPVILDTMHNKVKFNIDLEK